MRRNSRIFCLAAALLVFLCTFTAQAQGYIYTKKMRLADFQTKTIKVVKTGNAVLDEILQQEMSAAWYISPYEYCTMEEFSSLVNNAQYYFLHFVTNPKNEDFLYLAITKGGTQDTMQTTDAQYEAIRIPYANLANQSGREYVYLPALLTVLQQFMRDAVTGDYYAYLGMRSQNLHSHHGEIKKICISYEDFPDAFLADSTLFDARIEAMEEDLVDLNFLEREDSTLVSYTVTSSHKGLTHESAVMLFHAKTGQIYYYNTHKYLKASQSGFTKSEIKRFRKKFFKSADRKDK